MTNLNNNYSFAFFIALASTFFYSLMDTVTKYALNNFDIHFSTFYFQFNIIILTMLIPLALIFNKNAFTAIFLHEHFLLLTLRCSTSVVYFILATYILKLLPLSLFYSIIFLTPIIASIIAIYTLGEKLTLKTILALAIGMTGILIIINPFSSNFNSSYIIPFLLAFILPITVALSGTLTRKYFSTTSTLVILIYAFAIGSIVGFLLSYYHAGFYNTINFISDTLIMIVPTAVFCLLGMHTFIKAYQMAPIHFIAPVEYALMFWGLLFGYILFDEQVTFAIIFGCMLVILSNMISSLNFKNAKSMLYFFTKKN